jgi:hypothetical protein
MPAGADGLATDELEGCEIGAQQGTSGFGQETFAASKRGSGRARGAGFAYPRQRKSRAVGSTVTTAFRLTASSAPQVATSGVIDGFGAGHCQRSRSLTRPCRIRRPATGWRRVVDKDAACLDPSRRDRVDCDGSQRQGTVLRCVVDQDCPICASRLAGAGAAGAARRVGAGRPGRDGHGVEIRGGLGNRDTEATARIADGSQVLEAGEVADRGEGGRPRGRCRRIICEHRGQLRKPAQGARSLGPVRLPVLQPSPAQQLHHRTGRLRQCGNVQGVPVAEAGLRITPRILTGTAAESLLAVASEQLARLQQPLPQDLGAGRAVAEHRRW